MTVPLPVFVRAPVPLKAEVSVPTVKMPLSMVRPPGADGERVAWHGKAGDETRIVRKRTQGAAVESDLCGAAARGRGIGASRPEELDFKWRARVQPLRLQCASAINFD